VAPLRKEFADAFRVEVAKYRALFGAPFRPF
jgi:hypothetical protein